jgi:hypothetical protein
VILVEIERELGTARAGILMPFDERGEKLRGATHVRKRLPARKEEEKKRIMSP